MSKSKFSDNLLKGLIARDEDWNEHLKNIHTVVPSMTPPVFGAHRTRSGLNSYEILAAVLDAVPQPFQILDLACGDGFLMKFLLKKLGPKSRVVGVDMVPAEIDRARSKCTDSRVRFTCETAQNLTLETNSCDLVLCHMALMLMLPIDPVILQVRRILKPGGKIAGIIGGPRAPRSVSDEIAKLIAGFLQKRFPKMESPRIGDERFSTVEGLKSLFGPSLGFKNDLKVEDFQIEVKGDGVGIWNFYKDMYLIGMLPPEIKNDLRQEMMDVLQTRFHGFEKILVEYPLRKFEVSVL